MLGLRAIYIRLIQVLALEQWRRRLVFWGGAVAPGAGAVAFAIGSERAIGVFESLHARFWWWPYAATPLCLALGAWLTRRLFQGAEGSGIPQTIAALSMRDAEQRDHVLSLRIVVGKLTLTLLALAGGASIGREGPCVQVGASIMHALRRFARFHTADIDKGLILAGGAAGVAAAFNTPLAGVVFAIEELSRSFEERASGTILTAVIMAGVTSLSLVGNYTYFGATAAAMGAPRTWLAIPLCGVVGGLCGGAFATLLLRIGERLPRSLQEVRSQQPVMFAALCGLALAAIGWLSMGTTFGTGYAEAKELLQHEQSPAPGFAAFKALATIVSYLTGVPGGIFAPSLSVGAGIGAQLFTWMPLAPAGAMVILSMAAYFAGVVQAPLTALVIVTEMTGNRGLVLPLMAVVLIGRATSAVVCRRPLYRSMAQAFLSHIR